MSDGQKKFTFEDWKEGRIPKPPCPDGYPEKQWNKTWGEEMQGNWLYYWSQVADPPRLSKDEHKKIEAAQKDAWERGIEGNSDFMINWFLHDCRNTPESEMEDVIRLEIEEKKEALEETGLLKNVKQRNYDYTCITPEQYRELEKHGYLSVVDLLWVEGGETIEKIPEKYELFAAAETYRYIHKLEEMLQKYENEVSENSEDPWDRLERIDQEGVKSFVDQYVSNKFKKPAKDFFTTFEIISKASSYKNLLNNRTQTVRSIKEHETFEWKEKQLPSAKTLRDGWLKKYAREMLEEEV